MAALEDLQSFIQAQMHAQSSLLVREFARGLAAGARGTAKKSAKEHWLKGGDHGRM